MFRSSVLHQKTRKSTIFFSYMQKKVQTFALLFDFSVIYEVDFFCGAGDGCVQPP